MLAKSGFSSAGRWSPGDLWRRSTALTIDTPVLAFNEQTGQNGFYPITSVHKNVDPAITSLTIQDPEKADQPEFITTTPEHPFYVKERSDAKTTAQPRPKSQGHEDLTSK